MKAENLFAKWIHFCFHCLSALHSGNKKLEPCCWHTRCRLLLAKPLALPLLILNSEHSVWRRLLERGRAVEIQNPLPHACRVSWVMMKNLADSIKRTSESPFYLFIYFPASHHSMWWGGLHILQDFLADNLKRCSSLPALPFRCYLLTINQNLIYQ